MAPRKAFPLRINEGIFDAIRAWAEDDLRSVNAQIEFLLARALREAGRHPRRAGKDAPSSARGAPSDRVGDRGGGARSGRDTDPETDGEG